jgi:uncharacterized repeat protein (TIGR03803 family)
MRSLLPLSIALLAASTAVSAQTFTVLHNFGSKAGDPTGPVSPGTIAQGRGGAMLTTAQTTAFRIWPSGSLQVLHQFGDGGPWSGLILATDGRFYGTTRTNGTFSAGTVFKMSQDGRVTKLHDFTGGSDGDWPYAAPIQSVEGDFYGTTGGNEAAGVPPYGSAYRITKYGNFTLLHDFTFSDGSSPRGPLVQGVDYYFYGTTVLGGQYGAPYGYGTIFRVSSTGDFKVLVNFNGTNGKLPFSGLIQASDGNFYGVTLIGGSSNAGVLFRMTPGGALTVLHNFTAGSDGSQPLALVQTSDGNLYGVNNMGGKNGSGVLFRATLAGDVVALHDFDAATGNYPTALFQHTNGMLYGDTYQGGTFGRGVFYSLDAGLPPFVSYLPTYGRPGAEVQILGQGFTADSKVSFKGTPATSPVVVNPTYIRVIVPAGATTGPITVTTSSGTLTSNKVFIVHPQ